MFILPILDKWKTLTDELYMVFFEGITIPCLKKLNGRITFYALRLYVTCFCVLSQEAAK